MSWSTSARRTKRIALIWESNKDRVFSEMMPGRAWLLESVVGNPSSAGGRLQDRNAYLGVDLALKREAGAVE